MTQNEISTIKLDTLAGTQQKISIEGKTTDLPILIYLHGGPGFPLPLSVGLRGQLAQVTDHFLLVCWDQYGCGANRKISADPTIHDYVEMTIDLIKHIRNQYPENKLYLFATSWGSILSARAAYQIPEAIDGVYVVGQICRQMTFNEEVYNCLESADLSEKNQKRVAAIRTRNIPNGPEARYLLGLLGKHTNANFYGKTDYRYYLSLIQKLLQSRDYSIRDRLAVFNNPTMKNEKLLEEILAIDLTEELSQLVVSYQIFQGETDVNTSTETMRQFVAEAGNPALELEVIPRCGHMPTERIWDDLMERIIAERR